MASTTHLKNNLSWLSEIWSVYGNRFELGRGHLFLNQVNSHLRSLEALCIELTDQAHASASYTLGSLFANGS
jgi:hypothetical protein